MKLKVCGMKYQNNIEAVSQLQPDYLGFIFHKPSPRYFEDSIPEIDQSISKVGVFVDYDLPELIEYIKKYDFKVVQLHGEESPEFCKELREYYTDANTKECNIKIMKVFSIRDTFDFKVLAPYEPFVDYFLFDTKGELAGGNGYVFNWDILQDYPSTKPFFLSGGIGLDEVENTRAFKENPVSKYCHAIDVNSKFEIEPGLKDIEQLKEFKNKLSFRT